MCTRLVSEDTPPIRPFAWNDFPATGKIVPIIVDHGRIVDCLSFLRDERMYKRKFDFSAQSKVRWRRPEPLGPSPPAAPVTLRILESYPLAKIERDLHKAALLGFMHVTTCKEEKVMVRMFRPHFVVAVTALAAMSGQATAQALAPTSLGDMLPENIQWRSFPAFPKSVQLAIVVGDPQKAGPFVVRVKVPADAKIMPHRHPEDRIYTIISGVFYIGIGDKFEAEKLKAYGPGSVIVLPGNTPHFHWAR